MSNEISWTTPEYAHSKKPTHWYLAVILIIGSIIATALLFNNILFAILIFVAAVALLVFARREPRHVPVRINDSGILFDEYFYPFATLESFWVSELDHALYIKSKKFFMPYITIPLADDTDHEILHEYLLEKLPDEEHHASVFERLMDYLGF